VNILKKNYGGKGLKMFSVCAQVYWKSANLKEFQATEAYLIQCWHFVPSLCSLCCRDAVVSSHNSIITTPRGLRKSRSSFSILLVADSTKSTETGGQRNTAT
jgi:hypothetical protein